MPSLRSAVAPSTESAVAASHLTRPDKALMCPPGFAVVKGHYRVIGGTRFWVKPHWRRLSKQHTDRLLIENLHYLFWNSGKRYSKLNKIKGFEKTPNQDTFDSVIQFWLEYWRSNGYKLPGVDPLLIKAQIAYESTFRQGVRIKSGRIVASGLMQVTNQALAVMAGAPNSHGWREIRKHQLFIRGDEILDPVVNVAAGIRWLAHKYTQIPKGTPKTVRNLLRKYNGGGKEADAYADKILKLYQQSK